MEIHMSFCHNLGERKVGELDDRRARARLKERTTIAELSPASPPRWYVVYTKPSSEKVARDSLARKGIDVFLPKIEERDSAFSGGVVRIAPLFPGYLFARISVQDDYYKVIWARGVKRLVGNGEGPLPLDDSVVDLLMRKTGERGIIRPSQGFNLRDRVRVRSGPFEGLLGIVNGSLDKRERIKVLMSLLQEGTEVELPCCLLEKCA
jgi:transcriptional antiterminator RfaH